MKIVFGLLLALTVGIVCRLVGLPLPAPLALRSFVRVNPSSVVHG
jgi:XapX domain-containing protein